MTTTTQLSRPELNKLAKELGVAQKPERYDESFLRFRVDKALARRAT